MEVIASARVPIVKCKERFSGISIDIAFEQESGLATRALINDYIRRYPAVRPLALVMKYFLMQVSGGHHDARCTYLLVRAVAVGLALAP